MSGLPELFSLRDKVALVTGASSGIGREMALTLAHAGASVVLLARDPARLGEAARQVERAGSRAAVLARDLSRREQVEQAAQEAAAAFGAPDILVNAAGVNHRPPLEEISHEIWDDTMAVNLTAPFLLAQRLAPAMRERGWGRIINLASQQSIRAFNRSGAYGVSKGGVLALTRSLAEAWSRYGVTCNAIAPGFIHTAMTDAIFTDAARSDAVAARTLIGRNGRLEDLRGVTLLLASAASDYITGQTLFVDGGMSAH
jgi:gluconate 5-dehydrogenase